MQGINRRGHLVLAGLIGVLIGVLVVVNWASPATTSARTIHVESARSVVNAANAPDATSQMRILHDVLAAKQQTEAESYPVHIADVSMGVKAEIVSRAAGPVDLHEALWAKQVIEAEAYPSRILFPSTNPSGTGDGNIRSMREMLLDKQRVEAEYLPRH